MGGGGDDMGVFDGVFEQTGGDESGGVCHVYHEDGADFVGEFTDAGIVPFAAVGRSTGDDEFGTLRACLLFHLLIVNAPCFGVHGVRDGVEHESGEVHGAAVAEVTAVAEVHTHEGVSGFEDSHEYGHVGLCAAVGLHVDPFGVEKFLGAFAGQVFGLVHYLAAAVVAVCGIALGRPPRPLRAPRRHHLFAGKLRRPARPHTLHPKLTAHGSTPPPARRPRPRRRRHVPLPLPPQGEPGRKIPRHGAFVSGQRLQHAG